MQTHQSRITRTQELLIANKIDALLVTNQPNIFYLTGISEFPENERDCKILVTKGALYLFTDFRYKETVITKAPFAELVEVSHSSSFIKGFETILQKEKITIVGIEGNSLYVLELGHLEKNLKSQKFISINKNIESLRSIKDQEEIKNIQRACDLTDQALEYIVRHIKSGVSEKEIAWEIEKFIKEHDGELAFPSIVAFGSHGAIPHHSPTTSTLSSSSQILLLDMGAKVNGYSSDMTRCFFVKSPSSTLQKAYEDLLLIQTEAIEELGTYSSPKFEASLIQKNADAKLKKNGYSPIPHGIGHGVGINVHEAPTLSGLNNNKLTKNMIVTVEPGIYIPQEFGFRIEDTVLLGDTVQCLTRSPKKLSVLSLP